MHETAPVLLPAFVIEPAAHSMQDAMFDAVENLPAAHGMHNVAPVPLPWFVLDPAAHRMHAA